MTAPISYKQLIAMKQEARALGVDIQETGDGFTVRDGTITAHCPTQREAIYTAYAIGKIFHIKPPTTHAIAAEQFAQYGLV